MVLKLYQVHQAEETGSASERKIIAVKCDVPRPRVEIAEKLLKKSPEIAKRVERDEIDLEQAARQAGILRKSSTKKIQVPSGKKGNGFRFRCAMV